MKTLQIPRIACKVLSKTDPPALFSLFRLENCAWKQVRSTAFPWDTAKRVFRSVVITDPYRYQVRVVKVTSDKAHSRHLSKFRGAQFNSGIRRVPVKQGVNDGRNKQCD